ncbi:IclR family transcriptional regulator [Nocardioides mangrovicus]|uniref:IclR family transcriptional regulator n=1 Tax=Nocardioides mangrovicus TaxID=2478913 RepID=UPI0013143181|nr:IclR family transcriptional regulator [Nocardioides mangrovicus]
MDRAASLLRAVAEAKAVGAGTTALGRTCGVNRATAWRILSTLRGHGLVEQDPASGRWSLGAGIVDLVRTAGLDAVLHEVHEVLEHVALQTGETAALAQLRNGVLTYVDEAAPAAVVSVTWVDRPLSLHATSTGKVVLAWSAEQEVERLLPRRLERFTSATVTDRRRLRADLDRCRERGYATCRGEFDESAWGVSAPVVDPVGRLLAVVSIWGPPPRVGAERFPALAEVVRAAADQLAPG